jgi:hypothetical protein
MNELNWQEMPKDRGKKAKKLKKEAQNSHAWSAGRISKIGGQVGGGSLPACLLVPKACLAKALLRIIVRAREVAGGGCTPPHLSPFSLFAFPNPV